MPWYIVTDDYEATSVYVVEVPARDKKVFAEDEWGYAVEHGEHLGMQYGDSLGPGGVEAGPFKTRELALASDAAEVTVASDPEEQWFIISTGEYNSSLYGPYPSEEAAQDAVRADYHDEFQAFTNIDPCDPPPAPDGNFEDILVWYNPDNDIGATSLRIVKLLPPSEWHKED